MVMGIYLEPTDYLKSTNCSLRIIVSSIKNPLFWLAVFIKQILHESLEKTVGHVTNSRQLVEELSGFIIESDHAMISLDVTSLFTNVPIDLALESISRRWNSISQITSIPEEEFKDAVKFVLDSTYFMFNNVCYRQTYGTPMSSPLSPIIADLVMQDLETAALESLPFNLSFYYRYVDDIILISSGFFENSLNLMLQTFNSQHGRLQFTMKTETDKKSRSWTRFLHIH